MLDLARAGTGVHNVRHLRDVKADGEQHVAVDLAEVLAWLPEGTAVQLVVGPVGALLFCAGLFGSTASVRCSSSCGTGRFRC